MRIAFEPSVILSETYFAHLGDDGVFADAFERIADEGFFRNIELTCISSASHRARMARAAKRQDLSVTYWLTHFCIAENLDLSSTDAEIRRASVKALKDRMPDTAEFGRVRFAVACGPDPGPSRRKQATSCFHDSLHELAEAASAFPDMSVIFEPVDREAYKKGLIGPTPEFVQLAESVRREFPHTGICWDCGHIRLSGEDLPTSLAASKNVISQVHLSNAVLDPARKDFGDRHMPIGPPGFLTEAGIVELLTVMQNSGLFDGNPVPVAIEVRTVAGGDPWENVAECQRILTQAQSDPLG